VELEQLLPVIRLQPFWKTKNRTSNYHLQVGFDVIWERESTIAIGFGEKSKRENEQNDSLFLERNPLINSGLMASGGPLEAFMYSERSDLPLYIASDPWLFKAGPLITAATSAEQNATTIKNDQKLPRNFQTIDISPLFNPYSSFIWENSVYFTNELKK